MPRCGEVYHVNGASHNSQGGTYPEVVRIYRGMVTASPLGSDWVMEYSVGPKEEDGERYQLEPGDSWDRDNAPECTKGFRYQLIAAYKKGGGSISTIPTIPGGGGSPGGGSPPYPPSPGLPGGEY